MSSVPLDQPENPVDKIVSQVKDVAVLPQVVFKIMETTGNTETSPAELERDIIVDPGFSAKVLAMANSAHFALPKRVTSIRDAIAFLGLKQVRQLAMHAGVFDLFVGKTDKESLRRRAWWRHSLDTAVCAKWMAGQLRGLNPEEAYAAGLLHLIGKTIMDRSDPEMYSMVMMASEKAVPTLIAEKHFFGCNHVAVGAAICANRNKPTCGPASRLDTRSPNLQRTEFRATVQFRTISISGRWTALISPIPCPSGWMPGYRSLDKHKGPRPN